MGVWVGVRVCKRVSGSSTALTRASSPKRALAMQVGMSAVVLMLCVHCPFAPFMCVYLRIHIPKCALGVKLGGIEDFQPVVMRMGSLSASRRKPKE